MISSTSLAEDEYPAQLSSQSDVHPSKMTVTIFKFTNCWAMFPTTMGTCDKDRAESIVVLFVIAGVFKKSIARMTVNQVFCMLIICKKNTK